MHSTLSIPQVQQRLINVDEYYKMAEHGIIKQNEKVELIYGKIIQMSPNTSRHAGCVDQIIEFLYENKINKNYKIRSQNPIRLNNLSEPEPDISILKYKDKHYTDYHPIPGEIFVVIEVALSSLYVDRVIKSLLYAENGIPEYWIINLKDNVIEYHANPSAEGYQTKKIFTSNQSITSDHLKLSIQVDQLLS
ncbi:MAG: Uma2 family endonuclease [Bacteroidota bacterium]